MLCTTPPRRLLYSTRRRLLCTALKQASPLTRNLTDPAVSRMASGWIGRFPALADLVQVVESPVGLFLSLTRKTTAILKGSQRGRRASPAASGLREGGRARQRIGTASRSARRCRLQRGRLALSGRALVALPRRRAPRPRPKGRPPVRSSRAALPPAARRVKDVARAGLPSSLSRPPLPSLSSHRLSLVRFAVMGKNQSKLSPEQLSDLQKNTYCELPVPLGFLRVSRVRYTRTASQSLSTMVTGRRGAARWVFSLVWSPVMAAQVRRLQEGLPGWRSIGNRCWDACTARPTWPAGLIIRAR